MDYDKDDPMKPQRPLAGGIVVLGDYDELVIGARQVDINRLKELLAPNNPTKKES